MLYKAAIFNLVLLIGIFILSNDNALRWMPWDLTDDKSTLVQVMAWCHQATSHYLSQCWPSSMSPHGVTRPQWHKLKSHEISFIHNICYSCPMVLDFVQSMAVILPIKMIGYLGNKLWVNEILIIFCSLRWVSNGLSILHPSPCYVMIW